jgi:AmiR/NasT family two-component response regulator
MEAVQDGDSPAIGPEQLDALVEMVGHLERALESRDVIGQAKGILMERHHLDAEAAFARLIEESQHRNVKLHEVARLLAETGTFGP